MNRPPILYRSSGRISASVAQTASLPFRRLPVGGARSGAGILSITNVPSTRRPRQVGNLRNGRLAACATGQVLSTLNSQTSIKLWQIKQLE